tara:strand:- start:2254 stop:3849 length:1596 start_codon:yes stop_codon:yes gene_type:complete
MATDSTQMTDPCVWQYLIGEEWIDCTAENSKLLSNRLKNPTLEPIFLQNDKGIIWGDPETQQMKFRLNDELGNAQNTALRIGIKETEEAIHVVEYINLDNDVESHILIPPKAQELLSHINHPNSDRLDVKVGPDCLVAQNGNIYMKTAGNTLVRCRYGITNLSYSQFREMTRARFSWMFQGPFRTNRMHRAVRKLGLTLPPDESLVLHDLFDRVFDPNDEEATEYGPFQFQDFLISREKFGLATQLMDQFHTIAAEDWQPFSLVQNAKIEAHRKNNLPGVKLTIGGVVYMIVFDSGAGSSGSNAVLIRPSRYNKILTGIEEQFQEDSLRDLFAALTEIGFNPVDFVHNIDAEEMLTSEQKKTIIPLLHKVQHPTRYMGTRIQQLMPTLLDKFKECNIKMSTEEAINEKKLCPKIFSTLYSGLSVPLGAHHTFKEMISFIHQQQSWIVPEVGISIRQCDICLDSEMPCVLTHCGQNGACLKCWADSLIENNMTCMFCRQNVVSGSLKILVNTEVTPEPNLGLRRSKRRKKTK